jgi:tripartite-type tricarboxylate transporter receptor subunit TctC
MKSIRPILTSLLCSAIALPAFAFPDKPITIIVPTAAGGGNDAMTRAVANKLGPLLGQSIIVDNKAGANGSIASEFVAKAPADGHTLMLGYVATHAMNPALQKLRYDPVADFEPIGLIAYSPTLMVSNPSVPAKDVKELVALLKANPAKYNYASAGNGTAPHFAAELFKMVTNTSMEGVPYKGSSPAVMDTLAGQTHVMFPSLITGFPHVKSGKLRALAIAGPKRSTTLPDVPTLREMGVDGVDVTQWYGLFAPAKTPKPIIEKINKALVQVLADPDLIKRIEGTGSDVESGTPEQLRALVQSELTKWKSVVASARLVPN